MRRFDAHGRVPDCISFRRGWRRIDPIVLTDTSSHRSSSPTSFST